MKNHLRAQHCNQCGSKLAADRMPLDSDGRAKLYADIAHPINSSCREMIQDRVISEYDQELELAKQPGYVSRYDDFDSDYTGVYRRGDASSTGDERRVDAAHDQPAEPQIRDRRSAGEPTFSRGGASPDRPTGGRRDDDRAGNFGAGIFPEN
jgi:stage V sporulation protein G